MHTIPSSRRRPKTAVFTMAGIVILLLLAIALPNFIRARSCRCMNACVNNLRQIDGAKQQWALENKKAQSDIPTPDEVRVYIRNERFPTCPEGGICSINPGGINPTCSQGGSHVLPPP